MRKTTATGMRSGFTLEQIAHVTKLKNLDSLKHYVDAPTLSEQQSYNKGLYNYGAQNQEKGEKRSQNETPQQKKKMPNTSGKENIQERSPKFNEMAILNTQSSKQDSPSALDNHTDLRSIMNNQLCQAPNLFQNAIFSKCNFNFTLPH